MAGKVWLSNRAGALLDEIPAAYKDIDQVMADQADLAHPPSGPELQGHLTPARRYRCPISSDRHGALTKDEVERLPENLLVPPGAQVVYSHATGTGEGCGFDNLDMSACFDRRLEGPLPFDDVVRWYRDQLHALGWPADAPVAASNGTRWRCWERGLERVDLIDRVIQPDSPVARIPRGWRGQRLRSELPPG